MDTAPSTSADGSLKTFQVSNLAVDVVCEILQTCKSEQSDAKLSDSHIQVPAGNQKLIDTKLMMMRF
jgi:hypothetical protein